MAQEQSKVIPIPQPDPHEIPNNFVPTPKAPIPVKPFAPPRETYEDPFEEFGEEEQPDPIQLETLLTLYKEPSPKSTTTLAPQEGEQLRNIIEKNTKYPFTSYVNKVGLHPSNVYAMLSGNQKLSASMLNRLFSATELEVKCQLMIVIQKPDGDSVHLASDTEVVDALLQEEMDSLRYHQPDLPSF